MAKVMKALVLVVLLTVVFVVGFIVATRHLLQFDLPFQSRGVDRSQPPVLKSVRNISEYHSAVGNFSVVVDYEQDVKWVPGFIAGRRSLFVAAGSVDAYVDFSHMTKGDVTLSKDGRTVRIKMPHAKLDKPSLDQEHTYLFSEERGVVNRIEDAISTQDQHLLYQRAEQKLMRAARESGLVKRADENTRQMLVGMFGALHKKVVFTDASND